MNTALQKTEAGKLKYILVWVLASIFTTIATAIPELFFQLTLDQVTASIGLHGAYIVMNGTTGLLTVFITLSIYALFKNIYIQRVMPYFWLAGAFGFIQIAGSWLNEIGLYYEQSGLLYVQIIIQVIVVFLLYWIPSTFWPRKYYTPLVNLSGRPQINRQSLNTSGTPQKDEVSIRREPTLSKPKRDQFQD
ncbi:hypothetical protein N9A67_07470 [Rhodobacteraceae bacterium]|nr:hypothetical protein [Paracoccaceae bacterium]